MCRAIEDVIGGQLDYCLNVRGVSISTFQLQGHTCDSGYQKCCYDDMFEKNLRELLKC